MPYKPLISAILLVILWVLEGTAPFFPGRSNRARHYAANLLLAMVNAVVGAVVFAAMLLAVSLWAERHGIGVLNWLHAPAWIEWPLAIVLFDLWQYAWHRLNHRVPLLWRFHAVHHADTEMDASTAVRFHTGEIVFSSLARLAIVPVLGMSIPQLAAYELLLLPVILIHHSNVNFPTRLDAALRWLVVTPLMHRVHHSNWRPETDSNYASIFSCWDRLFGSYRHREDPRTICLGLKGIPAGDARHFTRFFLAPFRRNPSGLR